MRRYLRRRRTRGQSLVETALILPWFFLIIFGLVDLGRGVYAYNTVANAARSGARVAAVNQIEMSPDCVNDRPIVNPAQPHWSIKRCAADAAIAVGITPNDVDVDYVAPPGSSLDCSLRKVGCIAVVTVHYDFVPFTPGVSLALGGGVNMDQVSEMPIERTFP